MEALFTLTPSESKRLIAKAVVAMPEVQKAHKDGYLLVGRGSTNGYIVEELLGTAMEKERYVAGQVIRGVLCALDQPFRGRPVSFHRGKVIEVEPGTLIEKLGPGDVVLKGANAVDRDGAVGVVMASPVGGTMGQFYMAMKAQGIAMIFPVGLEKLVPSVPEAAQWAGRLALGRTIGARVGMACVVDGTVVTELEALDGLFGVDAVHFASGGYGGAEGSVILLVDGPDDRVNACLDFIEGIKGEPPLRGVKGPCKTCPVLCSFQGKEETDIPHWLR
ncbi:MAG TPA: hypothetical protein PKY58_10815 [Syntrophales bacterium]|nr:hypothetical protein [Syntrophales bacterium]HPX11501.1 hypothetical protein [Syntrophales bacterium]HQB30487.1 hypothetical protein [Syntrophales bacterium]HQN78347.1 hypothetical protein [Syntrophales bacterium]HQQ28015.1 hypothetical protein [Syntrophales bacterium]